MTITRETMFLIEPHYRPMGWVGQSAAIDAPITRLSLSDMLVHAAKQPDPVQALAKFGVTLLDRSDLKQCRVDQHVDSDAWHGPDRQCLAKMVRETTMHRLAIQIAASFSPLWYAEREEDWRVTIRSGVKIYAEPMTEAEIYAGAPVKQSHP